MAIVQPTDVMSVADAVSGARAAPAADRTAAQPVAATQSVSFALAAGQRELRLDLFRGLALWLIYIDHVSPDLLTWFTIRNYGFSDAAEIFIFISGFTAALVYGRATFEKGFVIGTARIARRVWQIYTAHLLLFLVLMAEIAFVTAYSGKQFYEHEMVVGDFFRQPGADMIQALFLRFRPLNMDVLPLYVVLMSSLPLVLLLARWKRDLPLVVSIALYIVANRLDLHFSTYPDGFWSFNPFGWQLLFVFGAWCALGGAKRLQPILASPVTFWLAIAYHLRGVRADHDLVFPAARKLRARLAVVLDLSHQQDRLRYPALCPFPGARRRRFAFRAGQLGRAAVGLGAAPDPLRSILAADLCARRCLVICGLRPADGARCRRGAAFYRRRDGHPHALWRGARVHVVQTRHGEPGARQNFCDVYNRTDI